MIKGVTLLEEFPVYDKFWMPLLYITLGLLIIATIVVTIYCCKNKWWFCDSSQRTTSNKLLNTMIIMMMYGVATIACMFVMMATDMILTACKFEGVKGDTVQYKVQVDESCSFIEFTENYNIVQEYGNNIYLIEVKKCTKIY